MDNQEIEVPCYFKCPISMELMKDPVTLCTGVSYDRESIEEWIYTCKKRTCPTTRQKLENLELIPNHMLRRLIQGWCLANSCRGVERIPTPRPQIDSCQVAKLLQDVNSPPLQAGALRTLRDLAKESERNRRCIVSSGSIPVLASIINAGCNAEFGSENSRACEEALGILNVLPITDPEIAGQWLHDQSQRMIRCMASILQGGTCKARLHAVMLLQKLPLGNADWEAVAKENDGIFKSLIELLTDEVCHQAIMAALEVLKRIILSSRKNRLRAIEAGAVSVLVELLPDADTHKCENVLSLLDRFVDFPEGRAALIDHAMGIPAVSKKIMRVSYSATTRGIRILWSVCTYSPTAPVLRDMMLYGAVTKLCMLLHINCGSRTKQRVKELLKLHGSVWANFPCFPKEMSNYCPSNH